jgi:hypothetical protein
MTDPPESGRAIRTGIFDRSPRRTHRAVQVGNNSTFKQVPDAMPIEQRTRSQDAVIGTRGLSAHVATRSYSAKLSNERTKGRYGSFGRASIDGLSPSRWGCAHSDRMIGPPRSFKVALICADTEAKGQASTEPAILRAAHLVGFEHGGASTR